MENSQRPLTQPSSSATTVPPDPIHSVRIHKGPPPPSLPLHLIHPLLNTSPSPVSLLSFSPPYLAIASSTLLTIWHFTAASSTSSSPCVLLSQWPSPLDHQISAIALSPDNSALALSLYPVYPPNISAVALLSPPTCTLLTRFSLTVPLPKPSNSPFHSPLSFMTTSSQPLPTHSPNISHFPPRLRALFNQHTNKPLPSPLPPASHLKKPLFPFTLAVTPPNHSPTLFRFTQHSLHLFDSAQLHPSSLSLPSPDPSFTTHPVPALQPVHAQPHQPLLLLLAICHPDVAVLLHHHQPVLHMRANHWHVLKVCVSWQCKQDQFIALTLSARRQPTDCSNSNGQFREQLYWTSWRGDAEPCQTFSIEGVAENDVDDIAVRVMSCREVSLVMRCGDGRVKVYMARVEEEGRVSVFQLEDGESVGGIEAGDVARGVFAAGDHCLAVTGGVEGVYVQTVDGVIESA